MDPVEWKVDPVEWKVVSPYFRTTADRWISDAAPPSRHRFELVPAVGDDRNWHQGAARAEAYEWLRRGRQAKKAFAQPDTGIVTVFPQLAAVAGLLKVRERSDRPLVSWLFNTEGLNGSVKRQSARLVLQSVDRFVVHSRAEIGGYARLLGFPESRFEFVPFQYGARIETERPPVREPYIFATGSGYRDYGTFFEAVAKLGYPTFVLASDRILAGLTVPSNVTILDQIDRPSIRRYVRHARVNVLPLSDEALTAGLVTIVETFRHGRSLVTTDRPGIDDYCQDDKTVMMARLFDPGSMAEAIEAMWVDDKLRNRLDSNAQEFAEANCTDRAAGHALIDVLDRLA